MAYRPRKTRAHVTTEIQRAHNHNETPDLQDWLLHNTDLHNTNLHGANLDGADLTGTNLTDANLQNANLTHTNLSHTALRATNLTGANLTHTNLTGADLTDATYNPHQLLNTRGLNPTNKHHGIPKETWDQILPTHPELRELTKQLLHDWDGTLQEAIDTAELLRAA